MSPTDIDRLYTSDELDAVVVQAESLLGAHVDDLVQRYKLGASSTTPPKHRHRFVELLLRLRRAADDPTNGLAVSAAAVAIVEVSAVIKTFEEWRGDLVWHEFQEALQDPRSYLHATATLTVATALKEHHPSTKLVASSTPGASPDLRMVVTDQHDLAVEVKTSASLSQRAHPMMASEATGFIEKSLKAVGSGFKRQLAQGHPGMLIVAGFHMDADSFRVLGDAAVKLLHGRPRSHLLAIVVSHTRFVPPSGRMLSMVHETRIISNTRYSGDLRLVGEWGEDWRLEKVVGPSPNSWLHDLGKRIVQEVA